MSAAEPGTVSVSHVHIIHDLEQFEAPWNSSVLTLGVFDGMHTGHQALIQRLQKPSRKRDSARVLVTYHPHPDFVLGKRASLAGLELYTYEEKLALFQRFDLDAVIFLPFTMELARMTALRYLKEILLGKLKANHIIIGYDQCFGRGRKGNYQFLKQMSKRYGFRVERIAAIRARGKTVSTSRIRQLISSGDIKRANQLLGHQFFLTGLVVRGSQMGAKLGFPTANLEVPESKLLPQGGVYTAVAEYGSERYRAMVNIGTKPTFGGAQLSIEAHLLEFSGDLYGRRLRLFFTERLRDEQKFPSVEALVAQLAKDRKRASRVKL